MSKTKGVYMKLRNIFIVLIIVICRAIIAYKQVHCQLNLSISWY